MVDLVRAYSKRCDLLEDLRRVGRRLARVAAEGPAAEAVSVQSSGRVGRVWALTNRISESDQHVLVECFLGGATKAELAEQYGISPKSVQRLLRLHGTRRQRRTT